MIFFLLAEQLFFQQRVSDKATNWIVKYFLWQNCIMMVFLIWQLQDSHLVGQAFDLHLQKMKTCKMTPRWCLAFKSGVMLMIVVGWKLMNLDLELILNHKDIWLSFDIFHFRWHWSTRTCGRSSTSTGPRWSSPSQAGEFNFLLLATCAIPPNLENHATHGSAVPPIFIFILTPRGFLQAIIIIPNGVVSVSERTKPAIKIASFLPGFILMRAKT